MLTHTASYTHRTSRTHEDGQRGAGGAVQRQEAESDRGRTPGAQQRLHGLPGAPGSLQVRRRLRVRGEARQGDPERPVHAEQREERGVLQNRQNIRGNLIIT